MDPNTQNPFDLQLFISITIVIISSIALLITKNKLRSFIIIILIFYPFMGIFLPPRRAQAYTLVTSLIIMAIFSFPQSTRYIKIFIMNNKIKFLLVGLGSVISVSLTRIPLLYTFHTISFLLFIVLYILIQQAFNDSEDWKVVFQKFLFYIVVVDVLMVMGQLVVGTSFSFYSRLDNPNIYLIGGNINRFPGFFSDPLKSGWFASVTGSILFGCSLVEKRMIVKMKFLLGFTLSTLIIIYAGARTASLGLLIGVTASSLFLTRKNYLLKFFIAALLTYVIINLSSLAPSFYERFTFVEDSALIRFFAWMQAYDLIMNAIFLGHGIGSYYEIISNPAVYDIQMYAVFQYAESGLVYLLVEIGIVGLISFLIFNFYHIYKAFSRKYINAYKDNEIAKILAIGVIVWFINFITLDPFRDSRLFLLLILLLAGVSIHKKVTQH